MNVNKKTKIVIGSVLIFMSLFCIIISFFITCDNGLLLNLGTEIMGILITLFFVEVLVTKSIEKKSKLIQDKLFLEISTWANLCITHFRLTLKYNLNDVVPKDYRHQLMQSDPTRLALILIDFYNKTINVELSSNTKTYNNFTKYFIDSYKSSLLHIVNELDKFQQLYVQFLSVENLEIILEIRHKVKELLMVINLHYDFLHLSVLELSKKYPQSILTKEEAMNDLFKESTNVIKLFEKLLRQR